MKARETIQAGAVLLVLTLLEAACGGDAKHADTPAAATGPTTHDPGSSAPPSGATPPPPAPKGTFAAFALASESGKVDKIGTKDGAFAPDGVKDLVFTADVDGPVVAIVVLSVEASGEPNGVFTADTFIGDQSLPAEVGASLNQGKGTAGLGVYQGDKLLNGKDGSLAALGDGKHKLTLYISAKDAPKGAYKALVLFDNKSVATSPVATVK